MIQEQLHQVNNCLIYHVLNELNQDMNIIFDVQTSSVSENDREFELNSVSTEDHSLRTVHWHDTKHKTCLLRIRHELEEALCKIPHMQYIKLKKKTMDTPTKKI